MTTRHTRAHIGYIALAQRKRANLDATAVRRHPTSVSFHVAVYNAHQPKRKPRMLHALSVGRNVRIAQ